MKKQRKNASPEQRVLASFGTSDAEIVCSPCFKNYCRSASTRCGNGTRTFSTHICHWRYWEVLLNIRGL
jgi:hypothetical protein